MNAVLAASAHESIKSSRSLVARSPSNDLNQVVILKGKVYKRKAVMKQSEPVLLNLKILQRGNLSKAARSGYCQGGLSSNEILNKIEHQRENYMLMTKMGKVTTRTNKYVKCHSMSGKMMDR